ncbi:RNA-binding protein with serine-rich domain 1 [Mycena venus]|uniref:RNA-binding protein with serine-rich domain 1 n=1 Tax=Mycena venus TaxID=2733690 RepID=A0A8H6Y703_9AGAR|nr:RNA-binding protein with serine-rich domain 1 [Mycena venus]
MSTRGRSASPRPNIQDADMDDSKPTSAKPNAKVVIITNLSRNVVETHLKTIFGFYGEIVQIDLPVYAKSGQNRGKAALEYADPPSTVLWSKWSFLTSRFARALVLGPGPLEMDSVALAPSLAPALGRARPLGSADAETVPAVVTRIAVGPFAQPLSLSLAHPPRAARPLGATEALTKLPAWWLWPEALSVEGLLCSLQPFSLAIHVAVPFTLTLSFAFSFVFVVLAVQQEQEPL